MKKQEDFEFIYDEVYNKPWNFVENPETDACIQNIINIVSSLGFDMTILNYYNFFSRVSSMKDLRNVVKVLLNDYKYLYLKILNGEYSCQEIPIYDKIKEHLEVNPDYISVITTKKIINKYLEQIQVDINRRLR